MLLKILAAGAINFLASLPIANSSAVNIQRWRPETTDVLFDKKSGMQWSASDNGIDIDWYSADRHCASLSLFGGEWRLPTISELQSIYGESKASATPCGEYLCQVSPLFHLTGPLAWSSELTSESEAGNLDLVSGDRGDPPLNYTGGKRALCIRKLP